MEIYITIIIPSQCHTQCSHHWDDNDNMSLALKNTIRYRALFIFRLLNDARNRNNRKMRAEFYDRASHVSCTKSDDGEGYITVPMFFPRTPMQRSKFVENEIYSLSFWKSLRYDKPKWMEPRWIWIGGSVGGYIALDKRTTVDH